MTRALLVAALAAAPLLAPAAQTMQPDARPVGGTLRLRADRAAEALDLTVRPLRETGRPECPGLVDPSAPDAVVEWRGGTLRMTVRASFDATLAVAGPDGQWLCNDDSDGLMPVVERADAPRGRYAVWVGSLSPDVGDPAATLLAGRAEPAPTLDARARPTSGTVRARAGFEMESGPATQAVRAGGLDGVIAMGITSTNEDEFCTGFVNAAAPTAVVAYDGQGVLALAATSEDVNVPTDLVMLVRTPAGSMRCSDDFASSDPAVVFDTADRGDYVVWVGTFSGRARASTVAAVLTVSETAPPMPDPMEDFQPTPFSSGTYMPLRLDAAPAVRLTVGDEPAEATVDVLAEGPNPVRGDVCSGFVTAAPTATVQMAGAGPLAITARADADLVLLVQTPTGDWLCSDDADGLNPGVQIGTADDPTAPAGTYRVWVGTLADPAGMMGMEGMEGMEGMGPLGPTPVTVAAVRGELVVSQMDMGDGGMGMDFPDFMDGTYDGTDLRPDDAQTTLTLRDGAATAQVQAGGALINPVDGDACTGFVDARPTLAFTATDAPSRIDASTDADDLVMLVRTPSGRWLCSDDADGPSPRVETSEAGRHAVWVGTFSRRTEAVPATVTVGVPGM